jgi:hypothetical protein
MNTRVPEAVKRQADEMEALDAEILAQETPPQPPADDPPADPPAPTPAADDWQHKFQTLQGKYNAEVPGLRGQVAQLQQQIDELKTAQSATPTPAPAPAPPASTLITDEDTETYGDDLIDLMRRVVRETDAGEKARLTAEIADLRKQMAAQATEVQTVVDTGTNERRAAYFTELAKAVPTYEEVDNDQSFKDWLLQPDEFSGLLRNEILQNAYYAFDAARTAKVFDQYLAQATPPPPPPPPPVTPQDELASLVSPGQSRSAPVVTPDDGQKVWTVAEIDTFYKAVGRGDFRGQQGEAQRIEADIDRALLEGRVR